MSWETIRYEAQGEVGVVTLHRPEALNAYSVRMRDELHELFVCLRQDAAAGAASQAAGLRALLLQGAGDQAFCAGADLKEFLTAASADDARRIRQLRDVWRELREFPLPTVAALHGYVMGSGLEIALCCDLRIAAGNAVFGLPEAGLGILPAAGGTQLAPRAIGMAHAMDMLLTDRRLDAGEALARGLVTRVVPAASLRASAMDLARQLARAPAAAMRATRRALRQGAQLQLAQGLRLESRLAMHAGHDHKENF